MPADVCPATSIMYIESFSSLVKVVLVADHLEYFVLTSPSEPLLKICRYLTWYPIKRPFRELLGIDSHFTVIDDKLTACRWTLAGGALGSGYKTS